MNDDGIGPGYARAMARYNAWMNGKLYDAASRLSDSERKRDRGAFFKSIHGTLNHLLLVDIYLFDALEGRTPAPFPLDGEMHADFAALRAAREALDARILAWAEGLTEGSFAGTFSWYSTSTKSRRTMAMAHGVMHFFNHQVHHRGQATTLLTQAGVDVGPTDIHRMPGIAEATPA
jgi:uncharacterized damage-inducible protein DinB